MRKPYREASRWPAERGGTRFVPGKHRSTRFTHMNEELERVAYANDRVEASMIQGLLDDGGIPSVLQALGLDGTQLGVGALTRNPQRVMVRASQADAARTLLADALAEGEQELWPESLSPDDAEEPRGSKPRNYGLVGAYMRIYLWSFAIIAFALGVFLLLRAD